MDAPSSIQALTIFFPTSDLYSFIFSNFFKLFFLLSRILETRSLSLSSWNVCNWFQNLVIMIVSFYLPFYITSDHDVLETLRVKECNLEVDVNCCTLWVSFFHALEDVVAISFTFLQSQRWYQWKTTVCAACRWGCLWIKTLQLSGEGLW